MATPADSAAFDVVKTSMNLMFAREEYFDDITDLEHGPMALATLQRWDKRDEGSLRSQAREESKHCAAQQTATSRGSELRVRKADFGTELIFRER